MLTALLAAFLGGIILNFMPCVFPVISLKAMGLVRHGGAPARLRREGLAYLGGVVATMMLLAGALLAARAGGAAVGWGFQLQSPVVIAVLALVLLGAALNLAGLFEVGLGLQGLGHKVSGGREGALGAALTGALAIVVATPCTAPFMAGALGYALVQPPLVALGVFLALAIGFAAPFTGLSLVPALAARLPQPGPWLGVVKRVLAVPMFAAAVWLGWVLERQAGTRALALLMGCAVVLGLVAWLYGMAQRRQIMGRPAASLQMGAGLGLAALAAALVALPGLAAERAAIDASAGAPVVWSPARLAALRAEGRPVFLDFSASWCITCQVNEKTSLSSAAFRAALARSGTVYMIADSTNYDPRIDEALARFGRDGLPLYAVYPKGGGAPKLLPQVLTPGIVATALDVAARGPQGGGPA